MSMSRHDVAAYAAAQRRRRNRRPKTAREALRNLGLIDSFRFVLDFADDACITERAPVKALDTSGKGQDFFFGADATASATDPTIVGPLGTRTRDTYALFDGGDYFTLDEANPAWLEQAHKNSGTLSAFAWVYLGTTGLQAVFTTAAQTTVTLGAFFGKSSSNRVNFRCGNGSAQTLGASAVNAMALNTWNFMGVSFSEAVGPGGLILQTNGVQDVFDSTATSPSASAAFGVAKIGAAPNAAAALGAGTRIRLIGATDAALSAGQLDAIYRETKNMFVN